VPDRIKQAEEKTDQETTMLQPNSLGQKNTIPGERPLMHDQLRDVALRLLWAARDVHVEHQSEKEWSRARFRAKTTLDLVAAGERTGLSTTGYYRHAAAVEWLEATNAIEPDPYLWRIEGGPIYRITARGVEMLAESSPIEPTHPTA
jgi:hypothetical protein